MVVDIIQKFLVLHLDTYTFKDSCMLAKELNQSAFKPEITVTIQKDDMEFAKEPMLSPLKLKSSDSMSIDY